MPIDIKAETSAVIACLELRGYSKSTLTSHRRCYDGLQAHFASNGLAFTMDESVKWLESRRPGWSHATYCQYRSALFRLERKLLSNSVERTMCRSADGFACRDAALKLPKPLHELYCEVKSAFSGRFHESSVRSYSQGCKDFLLFISEQGCLDAARLTIDPIIGYADRLYRGENRVSGQKSGWLAGIVNLLAHSAGRGDIPLCYASVLPRNTAALQLLPLRAGRSGTAFQPSRELEPLVPAYLSSLDGMRYNSSSKKLYGHDLTNFFLFLELNHIEYSGEAVGLWLEAQPSRGTLWERRRHTLRLFGDYLKTGTSNRGSVYTWQPLQIDSLPEWSRNIVIGFVAERKREGLAKTTLVMCRSAGYRFFSFLDSRGICGPGGITPELVKEFHNSEGHSTPESKNAYGIKVRQLLSYMAGQGLVPQNLFLAVSTQCAPRSNIVSVMSDEMVSAVYDYRARAATPLELRNAAVVMLGLRMGLRASDIAGIRIEDFDFQSRTVSLVQQKTRKEITLPVPADVGNSVYRYVMGGRPESGADGRGYVFIRHRAPFDSATRQICGDALRGILSEAGMELKAGDGFHITRRTFATRLLASGSSPDDIASALGHASPETSEVYLARDEERMRLCPLLFGSVGAS